MINHPDIPLGHITPSHQAFGWCLHCPDRSPAEELAAWQTRELRRLADETPQPEAEVVHGCPPDGSGLTPCCGRTPFELPLTDRISSEAPVTCRAAPAVAQPDEEADGNRIVAYRSALPGALSVYCTRHAGELGDGVMPLTSDDLPDGGMCAGCGVDVLIPPTGKEA